MVVTACITVAFCVDAIAAGGSLKIGYFDLQASITQSETGKKFIDEMKKKEDELSGALEQKGRAYMTAKEEYEKKRDVMDEKARARKEKELTDMYTEAQKMRADSSARLNEQVNAARAPIIKKVVEIANKIGKEDKYDFIFEKNAVVFSASDKDDLTKRITAELDKSPPPK
jgi:outer membrane protein